MLRPGWKKALFGLCLTAICLLFAFPILYLILTALRPASEVFYVWKGSHLTLANFAEALTTPDMAHSFSDSGLVATLATLLSLGITVQSGYMLSRFRGKLANTWFGLVYVFRTIPYITWVLPLYVVEERLGILDSFSGILLPHMTVHICFFSWLMKGFFDGIDPDMESAALLDGCSRWGAFVKIALPQAVPGMAALAILTWLWTWNEFLFALILTGSHTPMLSVSMAQFVREIGIEWNLMAATAVMALVPAILVTLFAQEYVVQGLRV